MKKLLSIFLILIVFATYSSAQGNLQFNQVINQTHSGALTSTPQILGTITVPAGKVWKVEAVSFTYAGTYYASGGSGFWAYIGDYIVYDGYTGGYSNMNSSFPLWLKPGTYDVIGRANTSYPNGRIAISAIEFNVIP